MSSAAFARLCPLTSELWSRGGRAAYQAGIDTGHASFAATAPAWEDFVAGKPAEHLLAGVVDPESLRSAAVERVEEHGGEAHGGPARAIAGECVGWAAVAPSFARPVYAGVMEVSLYVAPAAAGHGVGEALLRGLIASTEAAGVWTLEALIFPENETSLRLHRRVGFREVGVRERLGLMTHGPLAGRWRDVVLLERRSAVVGSGSR